MNKIFMLAGAAAVLLCCFCGLLPLADSTGSSSETIIGRIVNEDGSPSAGTAVTVLPFDYNPVTGQLPAACSDTTDEIGSYTVTVHSPFAAQYHMEAVQISRRTRALVTGISISSQTDTALAATGMLRKPGSVKVILSDTSADGFVYFPGTTLLGKAENCQAVIDSVPAGFIPAVYYANTSDTTKNHVTQTNITVSSGVTTGIIDLFGWKYSKKLYLNTTASGADVAQNVYNFPVLIRLTSSNFNFSQAVGNGADLRFTKSDNSSPLSYEIEQWDAGAQQAEVWVRVDTVYGNDNAHFIVMLWGNAGAAAASNPAAVFDTATGFQGVWHLSEPGNTTAYDATGNHYDGTPSGMTAAAGVTGAVGQAQEFDGTSNGYIQMKGTAHSKLDFAQHGAYSISAWVRVNVFNQDDTSFNCIVQKGDLQYSLQFGYTDKWQFCEYQDNLGWESDTTTATAGTWQYLVGIRQGTRQLLYLDGRLVCDTAILVLNAAPDSSLHARNTNYDVGIGRAVTPLWRGFNGAVDEVRIMNSMPTPDWIMLCYMNQKPDDALVQW